jgi:2'-hydroxyisoflavone reductase
MRVLIIGGTGFLGRHLSEGALSRGHTLCLFNRGMTGPDLFEEAEQIRGDRRTDDLGGLKRREFDVVIDTCAYHPDEIESLGAVLATAGHYAFVSSASVYADPVASGSDESAPLATLDAEADEGTDENYGPLKALSEAAAAARFHGRLLVVRPGLIVGPGDPTDRFTYWPRRVAEGGRLLAARAEQPVQLIDVRDLAGWMLDSMEIGRTGTYNAIGPAGRMTMSEMLATCRSATESDAEPVWVGDRFLRANRVQPWSDLPLWLTGPEEGFLELDSSKAVADGLCLRPLAETVADTLAWDESRPPNRRANHLSRARERSLLAKVLPADA